MRLSYILVAALSTLSALHDTVTASTANGIALTGVVLLVSLHLAVADQSEALRPGSLRDNKIDNGDNEERGFREVVEQTMAKHVVDKIFRTKSFSGLDKLEKTGNLAVIDKALAYADDRMKGVFKFADDANMLPDDMAKMLKDLPDVDDALRSKAVQEYTKYWNAARKVD
ncbi:hypothetical protein F441_10367 [Phytophthora nicotianae CJ01A1]|uniref:RxLR effector protein n=2 Tax=Phytophthora nicotianae TaxID=4792 RepID=W2HV45_PHYNI|nr:hypothetical protein L915_12705 [Phytophthora nicotianae]ETL25844.1 hypothetical protein L916_20372 [Phytophthora nicotianae]ETP14709.1 hypothetical protein F441_10367 [Phytophthora nicotianae CJ01A1]